MLPSDDAIQTRRELADSDAQHKSLIFRHLPIGGPSCSRRSASVARRDAQNVMTLNYPPFKGATKKKREGGVVVRTVVSVELEKDAPNGNGRELHP